ncbi:hypothetical protein M0802_003477 [Mischocyttarus mexicanus]|nr:hypothetical protein M0802_003477 [Mischocyttarus mexicanus]
MVGFGDAVLDTPPPSSKSISKTEQITVALSIRNTHLRSSAFIYLYNSYSSRLNPLLLSSGHDETNEEGRVWKTKMRIRGHESTPVLSTTGFGWGIAHL